MFEDLDDTADIRVPDDALARAKATGAIRVRRRYAIVGGVAAGLLLAASIPLLQGGHEGKTDVRFAHEPTTQSSETTDTTSNPVTSSAPSSTTAAKSSTVPEGLFAYVDGYGSENPTALVMRYDGTGRRVLDRSVGSLRPVSVQWSPDRSKVAVELIEHTTEFRQQYGRAVRIDVFSVATGRTETVYDAPSDATFAMLKWSPDSTRLAMVTGSATPPDTSRPYAVGEMDEKEIRVIDVARKTDSPAAQIQSIFDLQWSSDSKSLAYTDDINGKEPLMLVSASGGASRELAANAGTFAWSPVSDELAFTAGTGGITVLHADGTGKRTLTDSASSGWVEIEPEWSPDGKSIIVTGSRTVGSTSIEQSASIVSVDGTRWKRITNARVSCLHDGNDSCWTRDSKAIFMEGASFRLQPVDDSAPTVITDETPNQWRPSPTDSRVVAWTTQETVRVASIHDGAPPASVASGPGDFLEWTPDGMALVTRSSDPTGSLMVTRVDGRGHWNLHVT